MLRGWSPTDSRGRPCTTRSAASPGMPTPCPQSGAMANGPIFPTSGCATVAVAASAPRRADHGEAVPSLPEPQGPETADGQHRTRQIRGRGDLHRLAGRAPHPLPVERDPRPPEPAPFRPALLGWPVPADYQRFLASDRIAAELNVSVSVTESGSMLSGTPPASVAFAAGESTTLTVAISNGVTFGADQAVALALSREPCTSSRCSQTPIRSISWGQCAAQHPRSGHSPEWPWNSMPATRSLRHCR